MIYKNSKRLRALQFRMVSHSGGGAFSLCLEIFINALLFEQLLMHSVILKTLKRFRARKLFMSSQTELKSFHIGLSVIRNIAQIAMLDEEKVLDVNAVQSELQALSWLHKAAPCFPVNGSKVHIKAS